jgi:hypothetical protein
MCGTQPDNINSELGNLFPSRKKFQDAPRQYGKRASAWGSSRAVVSPAADIHGERPDAAWRLTGNAISRIELYVSSLQAKRRSNAGPRFVVCECALDQLRNLPARDTLRRAVLEPDPEKWQPVFRMDNAPTTGRL